MGDGRSEGAGHGRDRTRGLGAASRSPRLQLAAALAALAVGAGHAGTLALAPLRALFDLVFEAVRRGAAPTAVLAPAARLGAEAVAPPLAVVLAAVWLAAVAQGRLGAAPARGTGAALGRSLSTRFADMGGSLLGGALVGCVAGIVLLTNARGLLDLALRTPDGAAVVLGHALAGFVGWLAAAFVLIGLADWTSRRARVSEALRMTRREQRDTERELQGDPRLRARRRAEHAALVRGHGAELDSR